MTQKITKLYSSLHKMITNTYILPVEETVRVMNCVSVVLINQNVFASCWPL